MSHGLKRKKEEIQRFNESGIDILPEMLAKLGYVNLAVDWLGSWHKKGFHFYSGIPFWWLRKAKAKFRRYLGKKSTPVLDAKEIVTQAIKLIKNQKKFFLLLHF